MQSFSSYANCAAVLSWCWWFEGSRRGGQRKRIRCIVSTKDVHTLFPNIHIFITYPLLHIVAQLAWFGNRSTCLQLRCRFYRCTYTFLSMTISGPRATLSPISALFTRYTCTRKTSVHEFKFTVYTRTHCIVIFLKMLHNERMYIYECAVHITRYPTF
jgi:hypothetical protein